MKLAIKLMIEFAPLAIFFVVSTHYDPVTGTAVFMAATVVSVAVMKYLFSQVALMALITAATGLVAGAITVALHDPSFIQLKPTIVCLVFAAILALGLMFKLPLFQKLLGQELHITDRGWEILTKLWIFYFIGVALLNEYVRQAYSFDTWAFFKAFGVMPLTILYALPQMLLLQRYKTPSPEAALVIAQETEPDASLRRERVDANGLATETDAELAMEVAAICVQPTTN